MERYKNSQGQTQYETADPDELAAIIYATGALQAAPDNRVGDTIKKNALEIRKLAGHCVRENISLELAPHQIADVTTALRYFDGTPQYYVKETRKNLESATVSAVRNLLEARLDTTLDT